MADEAPKRRGTDWIAARDFWLALDPPRSYEAVAKQFGITGTRVRFVANRDRWLLAAAAIDAKVAAQTAKRIVRSRADRVEKVLGIVDGVLDVFDTQLDEKARDAKVADLPALIKIAELLVGEATDRVSFAELQESLGVVIALAVAELPKKARAAFLEKVRARLGAIGGDE